VFFSVIGFADDHSVSSEFSSCEGKFVNYYVAELTPKGNIAGMIEATKMHQKFYDTWGAKVKVYPALQYMRKEGGETEESLHRTSTMVVWESLNEWESWRSRLDSMSDSESKAQQKEYDAFVAKYNENTKVVSQNRWCML
jgi:hypothetical protein